MADLLAGPVFFARHNDPTIPSGSLPLEPPASVPPTEPPANVPPLEPPVSIPPTEPPVSIPPTEPPVSAAPLEPPVSGATVPGDTGNDKTGNDTPEDSKPEEGTDEEPEDPEEPKTSTVLEQIRSFATEKPLAFGGICAAAGVTLALLAALVVALIVKGVRRGRGKKSGPETEKGALRVQVAKLHEQGARRNQQDCFAVSPTEFADRQGLLAIVADGMGGLEHGERVSQAAVSAALNGFFTASGSHEQVLLDLLGRAVNDVDALLGPEGLTRGGSTMVMGLLRDGLFDFISVGDSRICLLRDGALYELNREHTYKAELAAKAASGAIELREVYEHPKRGGLTSYLGMGDIKYVDMPTKALPVRDGDKLVLMTDGVYNAVSDRELVTALSGANPADELRAIISSKGYTNQDNYTAVVLSIGRTLEQKADAKAKRRK